MDPITAFGIAATAASLACLAAQTVCFVTRLRDEFANLDIVILDLYTVSHAFELACRNIASWAQEAQHRFQSSSTITEVLKYLETCKMMSKFVQDDLARIFTHQARPAANIDLKAPLRKVQLVLHIPQLREHCARLDRQNNSLNLLLTTVKLSSKSTQESIVQQLRPTLRKDEESARTIVQSRFSTRPPSVSTSNRQSITGIRQVSEEEFGPGQRFSFEEDLYHGAVYRRYRHSRLSARSTSSSEADDTLTMQLDNETIATTPPTIHSETESITPLTNFTDELADDGEAACVLYYFWGTNGRVRTCADDLKSLTLSPRGNSCTRLLTLPMSNAVRMQINTEEQQLRCNEALLAAVVNDDVSAVAAAIDTGANVNAELGDSGETSLQMCFSGNDLHHSSPRYHIALLLLSYRQTHVDRWLESGMSLTHYCLRWELSELLGLLTLRPDIFATQDRAGRGALQALLEDAAATSFVTQEPIHELNGLLHLGKTASFNIDVPDRSGRTPLTVALEKDMLDSARILQDLGTNCCVAPSPSQLQGHSSPLRWAVANNSLTMVEFLLFEAGQAIAAGLQDSSLGPELLGLAVHNRFITVGQLLAKSGVRLDRFRPQATRMTSDALVTTLAKMQPFEVRAPKELVKEARLWTNQHAYRTAISSPFIKTMSARLSGSKLPFARQEWRDFAAALSKLRLKLRVNLFCDGWRLTDVPLRQVLKYCFELEGKGKGKWPAAKM